MKSLPILSSRWWRDPVALLVLLAAAPYLLDEYRLLSLGAFMPYAIAAAALAFVWGYCGILALGQAVFYGLGAYSCAKALESGETWSRVGIGLVVGMIASAAVAWLLARASFGARADVFLISVTTFCTAVAFEQLALKFTDLTGGQNGIAVPDLLPFDTVPRYHIAAGCFALALLALVLISRSDLGRSVAATRDNPMRLRFLGTDVDAVKRRVFVLGAVITSVAGTLDALYSRIAAPDKIGFAFSTAILLWCAIGGRKSITAAALGALVVNMVGNELSGSLVNYWQVILAVLFVLVVMYFPDGLYWPIRAIGRLLDRRTPDSVIPAPVREATGERAVVFAGNELRQSYGEFVALDIEELEFRSGEVTALIGPNGAGKSTFIAFASGGLPSATGTAAILGEQLRGRPEHQVARLGVKRKFQTPSVFDELTVEENLYLGQARPLSPSDWVRRGRVIELPADVHALAEEHSLLDERSREAGSLAHGSKQFLELCMVLQSSPAVVLLDEPTAGMSTSDRARIGEVLRAKAARGVAVLIIEHDFDFVRRVSDRVVVMNHGRLIADGSVDDVSANPEVRSLYLGAGA